MGGNAKIKERLMPEESLCLTCFNGNKRRWEKEDDSGKIFLQIRCNAGFCPANVTFMVVIECNKYDERTLTKKQFEENQIKAEK